MEDMKMSLIEDIRKRTELKIIEPENAKLLIKLIENADSNNEAMMIAQLGTMYRKTGLFYDVRLEKIGSDIKYLKKNDKLSFDNGGIHHKLIIGDNYDALQNLLISYEEKIDIIYIDPPYASDGMGVFADTNYENNITRDNLLSMLYPRLQLAKKLLTEEGVILCSIDDRNHAYVKCLFDDIFGEYNFIATCCKKGTGGKQDSNKYAAIHEYVLVYAKNINQFTPSREEKELSGFNKVEQDTGRKYKLQLLRKWGDASLRQDRPDMYYPLYYDKISKSISLIKKTVSDIEIYPIVDDMEGRWRWGKKTMKQNIAQNRVEVIFDNGQYIPYEKKYEDEAKLTKPYTTWLDDIKNDGATELKNIMGKKVFKYPKPVDLIIKLLMMLNSRDSIILDFFAGSGTTGHAVLALNKKDNGNRTFILCTNNEITGINPNGIAYDVTSERMKRIMTGTGYDGANTFKWLDKNQPYGDSLDVYEIEEVNDKERVAEKSPFEVIDETNYGIGNFENWQDKIEWVCKNFSNTRKYIEEDEQCSNQ